LPERADVVLSVGLIEHFDQAENAKVVAAHFDNAKPGGWVLISFPNPTWLYRASRASLEFAGLWRFPDERPLRREDVLATASRFGVPLRRTRLGADAVAAFAYPAYDVVSCFDSIHECRRSFVDTKFFLVLKECRNLDRNIAVL
jgi:hypothetical protein